MIPYIYGVLLYMDVIVDTRQRRDSKYKHSNCDITED